MSTLFLVNRVAELKPDQTTTGLLLESAARGPTFVAEPDALTCVGGHFVIVAAQVGSGARLGELVPTFALRASEVDRILVRLNPGRDPRSWVANWVLTMLEQAEAEGAKVVNSSVGLRRFGSKSGLRGLPPEALPETVLSTEKGTLKRFVETHERCVLKPASGTQGRGVFILGWEDPNAGAVIDLLLAEGPVVAQEWLPEAVDGDQRILIVDGEILEVAGHPAVVRRRPRGGELRSNVHLGAVPEPGSIGPEERRLVERVGPVLRDAGVRVAGLDCIGGKVIEVNAWSPGGLGDMATLRGLPVGTFYEALLDALG